MKRNVKFVVPKLLTWIIIDEVDLDLPCGVCTWCDELRTTVRVSIKMNCWEALCI